MTTSFESTAEQRRAPDQQQWDAQQAGDAAADALKAALARVGLALPSLRGSQPVNHHGFVELGGCGAELANRNAEVVNAAADALQVSDR